MTGEPSAPTPVTDGAREPRRPGVGGARTSPALEISNAIVGLHKQYFGKGPESAKTHIVGDTVVVVLRGGYHQIEQTLYESGHGAAVLEQRRHWQSAMSDRFKDVVRNACGREVLALVSGSHQDPDLSVEFFLVGDRLDRDGAGRATAADAPRAGTADGG
ncbi:Na-translocating system protein MpsC family protein, partial [Patulibacter sp. S7RM1-6]